MFGVEEGTYEVFLTRRSLDPEAHRPRSYIKMWYYYGGENPRAVKIFQLKNTITSGSPPKGLIQALRDGDIIATVEEPPDCLDQSQIDQILEMGGTVPAGRGCPGSTHAPLIDDPDNTGQATGEN